MHPGMMLRSPCSGKPRCCHWHLNFGLCECLWPIRTVVFECTVWGTCLDLIGLTGLFWSHCCSCPLRISKEGFQGEQVHALVPPMLKNQFFSSLYPWPRWTRSLCLIACSLCFVQRTPKAPLSPSLTCSGMIPTMISPGTTSWKWQVGVFLFSPVMSLQLGWGKVFLMGLWGHLLYARPMWQWQLASYREGAPNFLNACCVCNVPLTLVNLALLLGSYCLGYIISRAWFLLLNWFRCGPWLCPEHGMWFLCDNATEIT